MDKSSIGILGNATYRSNDQDVHLTTSRTFSFLYLEEDPLIPETIKRLESSGLLDLEYNPQNIQIKKKYNDKAVDSFLGTAKTGYISAMLTKASDMKDKKEANKKEKQVDKNHAHEEYKPSHDLEVVKEEVLEELEEALAEMTNRAKIGHLKEVLAKQAKMKKRQTMCSDTNFTSDLLADTLVFLRWYSAFSQKVLPKSYVFIQKIIKIIEILAAAATISSYPDVYGLIAAAYLFDRFQMMLVKFSYKAEKPEWFRLKKIFDKVMKVVAGIFPSALLAFHRIEYPPDYFEARIASIRKATFDASVSSIKLLHI
ncbi:uncharacterized protein L201_008135 [Kwoniella dendrophila CBS 6074]|uniref:Uncharacterized protein n=1 Tax=Kwoniella dendrophila CBS 6074 TaxID=1295534 RepID=A0AAX4K6A3_9TREE